ncbi:MAG: UDP-glucose 4-epimerase GalE [Candidatus Buchananbacteria bacterium]
MNDTNNKLESDGKLILTPDQTSLRCLVIGGAGYIGSHITRALIRAGHTPVVFDNLNTGLKENLFEGVEFIKGDIRNESEINPAMKGIDVVIYLAAFKAAGESMDNPQKYAINNICGAINVLNAMCEANVNKIIFSSSAAVYGDPKYLPIDEDHPTEPINFYGFTKLKIERLLKWFNQLKGINFASLRYFNAVGYDPDRGAKGLEQNPSNLLPVLMEAAKGIRSYVEVYGDDYDTDDGSCVRDYVHVSDLASAHLAALNKLFAGSESMTLNLGSSAGISVFEMINEVKKISGVDFEVRFGPRRPGDPEILLANSQRACEMLGWKAQYSDLQTIVKTTWQAYNQ